MDNQNIKLIKEELYKLISIDVLKDFTDKEIEELVCEQTKILYPLIKANNIILNDKEKLENFKNLILSFISSEE